MHKDNHHQLDRAIAATLLRSHARLRGQEVRFLRGLTQRSQTEIAHRLGVKRVTVARWEAAPETPIPGPADRALRIDAAERLFGEHSLKMVVDQFPEIADARPAPLLMRFCGSDETDEPGLFPHPPREGESWHPAAAASRRHPETGKTTPPTSRERHGQRSPQRKADGFVDSAWGRPYRSLSSAS